MLYALFLKLIVFSNLYAFWWPPVFATLDPIHSQTQQLSQKSLKLHTNPQRQSKRQTISICNFEVSFQVDILIISIISQRKSESKPAQIT